MADSDVKVMSMTQIILIMVGLALVLGIVFGVIGGITGLPPGITGAVMGGFVGLIGVILLNKRKAALASRNTPR